MKFDPYFAWLGLRVPRPVAGLHITSTHITLAALRHRPLRLVALGRLAVPDAAVVDDEIRMVGPVVAGLRQLAALARIGPGTPTVAAIEPAAASIAAPIAADRPSASTCAVRGSDHERIAQVVMGAGLDLAGIDIVPAALARIGLQVGVPTIALRSPTGWSVTVDSGHIAAERVAGDSVPAVLLTGRSTTLHIGPDLATTAPLADVPAIAVPDDLRQLVDPGHDAVAIGAALAAFGAAPLIVAGPTTAGANHTAQPVERSDPRIDRMNHRDHPIETGANR